MTGFHTQADAIAAHGKQLANAVAPSLQEVVTASQISLGPNVMGEICQVYAFIFNDELDNAKHLVSLLPDVVEATGDELGKTADLYQNTDASTAGSMKGLHQ